MPLRCHTLVAAITLMATIATYDITTTYIAAAIEAAATGFRRFAFFSFSSLPATICRYALLLRFADVTLIFIQTYADYAHMRYAAIVIY